MSNSIAKNDNEQNRKKTIDFRTKEGSILLKFIFKAIKVLELKRDSRSKKT